MDCGKKYPFFFKHVFYCKSAKPGDNYTVQCVKLKGAITSISTDMEFKHLAVGTDKGYVSTLQIMELKLLVDSYFIFECP